MKLMSRLFKRFLLFPELYSIINGTINQILIPF
jgi:hypothetical protein